MKTTASVKTPRPWRAARPALVLALAFLLGSCASRPQGAYHYAPYEEQVRGEAQRRLELAEQNHSPAAPELVRTAPLPDWF